MSRTTRRRAVRAVAPVAGLLAAGLLVWQGSTAAFSATTANTADAWATGNLVLSNNGGGTAYAGTTAALINASNLVPSPGVVSTGAKCITVDSSGSLAGSLKFYRGTITDTNVPNPTSNLSTKVNLTVTAAAIADNANVDASCAANGTNIAFPGAATSIYTGTLNALSTSYAGTGVSVAAGAGKRVAYKISWAIDSTADNTYQGASTAANLVWEIQ
jgi:hypothetical protein